MPHTGVFEASVFESLVFETGEEHDDEDVEDVMDGTAARRTRERAVSAPGGVPGYGRKKNPPGKRRR